MNIVFSDFDGTLIENHHLKNKEDISQIESFRNDGNLFVVCTGRCLQEIKRDFYQYKIPYDYLILNNGSQIVNQDMEIIYESTIDSKIGKQILDELIEYKDMWVYYGCNEESYGKLNQQCYDQSTGKLVDIDFKQQYHKVNQFNILCYVQENHGLDIIVPLIDRLKEKYGHEVEIYLNTCFVDIVAKGCSKGNSIALLKDILKLDATTYAIGDSYNDLPMIEKADYGYTFKNVDISKEVKNQVNSVSELIQIIKGEQR